MRVLNYFLKDKVNAGYFFDNGWHINSQWKSFKCKKNMTDEEVVELAKKQWGWRLTYVGRNGVEIYPKTN